MGSLGNSQCSRPVIIAVWQISAIEWRDLPYHITEQRIAHGCGHNPASGLSARPRASALVQDTDHGKIL